jgi:thymidylate synthase (FAD)
MKTKIVSITKPLITTANGLELSTEDLICYVGRVSSPQNQDNLETAPKLLKYLIANKHWSPLEMVDFTVEIETSRAIAAQILRHRSFVFSEFSQRYSGVTNFEQYEARRQDTKNRQNSIDDMSQSDKEWFIEAQMQVWDKSFNLYNEAIAKGIAKEQARFLLPLNTSTRLYMKGSLRSWIHYLDLRRANGTQKEHSDIANSIITTILPVHFPHTLNALGWNT